MFPSHANFSNRLFCEIQYRIHLFCVFFKCMHFETKTILDRNFQEIEGSRRERIRLQMRTFPSRNIYRGALAPLRWEDRPISHCTHAVKR